MLYVKQGNCEYQLLKSFGPARQGIYEANVLRKVPVMSWRGDGSR